MLTTESANHSEQKKFLFQPFKRIKKQNEFKFVYERQCKVRDPNLILYAAENDFDHPRLGLSVSKRVGNAVVRNKWKRILREAFRLEQHELPNIDLVVIPKFDAKPELIPIRKSLKRLAQRAAKKVTKIQADESKDSPS